VELPMQLSLEFVSPPGPCGYLPDRQWQFENALIETMTPAEYQQRMEQGWRRFGRIMFRPRCLTCSQCQSIRVDVASFRSNRSQRRNRRENHGQVIPTIGPPQVTSDALELHDRYHVHQSATKGWPEHATRDPGGYFDSFVDQPFPVEEWRYHLGGRLVGIGYVDRLPTALSAIYFFSEPAEQKLGLGTWNVLCIIDRAAELGIPYVYLGYHIEEYPSLAYKANFVPNQKRSPDGIWRSYRS
jgi:leucyl-tRNA---protein transferase